MKDRILAEIRRTAAENDGVPLGARRFEDETGISQSAWRGKFWRNWSAAVEEAGFAPNLRQEAHQRDALIESLAKLALQHGRFPSYADVRLAKLADATFPTHSAFTKTLGALETRIALVRQYALEHHEYRGVLELLPATDDVSEPAVTTDDGGGVDGAVYLLKLGKHYKVGKSFRVPQRHREIAIELPEKPDVVHVITTDDPTGIEAYWHKRFDAKHTNGEWFALTRDDVRAFKRRKFM